MPSTISYHPASPEDTPILARIHCDAFASDVLMDLMYGPSTGDVEGFASDLSKAMTADPTARFVKAVDDETREIVGWSWWNIYLDSETSSAAERDNLQNHMTPPDTSLSPEAYLEYHGAVRAKRDKWIGGKPVAILQVLAVLPRYQGQGIGTQLVMSGAEEAKAHQLPAWLEASSTGYGVYKKCGFRDLGDHIDIDLTKHGERGTSHGFCMLKDVV